MAIANSVVRFARMRRVWVSVFTMIVSLSVLGAAYSTGTIPSVGGTIQGCYATHQNDAEAQGRLRVVSDSDKCRNNETPLAWNQDGGGEGKGSVLVGGTPNFFLPPVSTSTPPSATSTPIVVTTTVRVNGSDTSLQVVVPESSLPVVTSDLTHSVSVNQGDLISISSTISGGNVATLTLFTIAGTLCGTEDICTMAAPRDGTLKNLVVYSIHRFGNSFHRPSVVFK